MDVSDLKKITESLNGELLIESNGGAGYFQLSFPLSEANILKIQTLLSSRDLNLTFSSERSQKDSRIDKVLHVFQEFVTPFSGGDLTKSREILMTLSEQTTAGRALQTSRGARPRASRLIEEFCGFPPSSFCEYCGGQDP